MQRALVISACLAAIAGLAACNRTTDVEETLKSVNVIDETNLNDIMLTVGDPNEAVTYFQRAARENPDRIDLRRGLAQSLVRAKRPADAVGVWAELVQMPGATNEDRVNYADALIRAGDWDTAEAQLNTIPPTYETYRRYRLEAMVADSNEEWKKADSFYEIAAGLTTTPSGVLNNWGFSKLTRGDFRDAERLFSEAITLDGGMFTAKNNLVLARSAQRNYDMPVIPMSQTERAMLLHTAALAAIKQGDVATGKGLLRQAIDTHPQHFDAAVRSLEALEEKVSTAG
jgi:Flp pilus assembly protein TadD